MNVYQKIMDAAEKVGCGVYGNDISCNFKTRMILFNMLAESNIQVVDESVKIDNKEFFIHTLESLCDGDVLIEDNISDGRGVIINI